MCDKSAEIWRQFNFGNMEKDKKGWNEADEKKAENKQP